MENSIDNVLEQVTAFADRAHGGQMRKYAPERYIVHPVSVMALCRRHTASLPILAAALLHDVLEDTPVTELEMHHFLTTVMDDKDALQTTKLVVELTDVYTKPAHPRWNRRKRKAREADRIAKTSGDSQTVKYADIIDNRREIVVKDPAFAGLSLRECRNLMKRMPNGDATLYAEAMEAVEECIRQVPGKSGS